jgi:hypothetical protein
MQADDLGSMVQLIEALRPWLGDLVIIGGWAHRLHRFHPRAGSPTYSPLRTRDVDLAFAEAVGEGNIAMALRDAGFREDLSGDHTPPISQYRLGHEDQGFCAEFLTPLRGSGTKRGGTQDATVVMAGVTAQKLRHLDLLLIHPWTVRLDSTVGVPLSVTTDVQLPSPVTFIAQKLLIYNERTSAKRAQDALYVHDTLELFGNCLDVLKAEWSDLIRPGLPSTSASAIERLWREQFGLTNDVIRTAARIPQDRTLAPQRIQALCQFGLQVIFGST